MNATTRSLCLVLLVFLSCLSACGAAPQQKPVDILGQLEQSEVEYSGAQSVAQVAADQAKVKQREADAAEVAKTKAAQALAGNLAQAAAVRESQAREYKERMCKIDPARCAAPAPARADAPVPPPPAPLPPVPTGQFVDLKITAFADGGFSRFNGYPSGWVVTFKQTKFVLLVGDQEKASLSDSSSVGKCYRAWLEGFSLIPCP